MYKRKIKASPVKDLYKVPSHKNGSVMLVESWLERNACYYLEYSTSVEGYESQPYGFYYSYKGKIFPYTPDFRVIDYIRGDFYIEVKSSISLNEGPLTEDFFNRFESKVAAAKKLGYELLLVTDRQLNAAPLIDNLKLLRRYSGYGESTPEHADVLAAVRSAEKVSIGEIVKNLGMDYDSVFDIVLGYIARHELFINLMKLDISADSIVSYKELSSEDGGLNSSPCDEFEEFFKVNTRRPRNKFFCIDNFNELGNGNKECECLLEEKPFNDDLRKVAVKRLQYIKYIEKNIRGGWTKKNIEPLLEEIRKSVSEPVPSWRTLVYWRERYLSAEGGIGSLIPKFHHRGRREDRTSHEELECFNRSVDEKFLRLERLSVIKCYRYYLSLVAKLNCTLESSAQIGPVSLSAYYARIKKLPQYDVVAARFGKQFADKQFRVVGSHVPLTRVMERVEMDHTKLDVFLIDDSLDVILGRPYLTAMIDSYSGCIVGIYLSFSPPSYLSVSSCLFNALRNKESVLSNYEEVEGEWPCEGKIETLVVDNGKEFWSKNMEFACASLSTEVQYNPVRQPWLKPKVERIFKTINSDFVHTVPGTCFSNVAEKKEYNPEKHAVMRFSDFMEALHIWIVDIYHCSPGLKCSFPPIYRWMESVKDRPIKKYEKSEEKKLKVELGVTEFLKLQQSGVEFRGVRYTNKELVEFMKERKVGDKGKKVLVKIDPHDITSVYIYNDISNKYFKVDSVSPSGYMRGLSLFEHEVCRRYVTRLLHKIVDDSSLMRARERIHRKIDNAVRSGDKLKKGYRKVVGSAVAARFSGISSDNQRSLIDINKEEQEIKLLTENDKSLSKNEGEDSIIGRNWDDVEPY